MLTSRYDCTATETSVASEFLRCYITESLFLSGKGQGFSKKRKHCLRMIIPTTLYQGNKRHAKVCGEKPKRPQH